LVKYQAGLKSSLPLDRLALDFLPLPKSPERETRDVLLTTVPKKSLESAISATSAAGLTLTAAGVSPVSAAEVVTRSTHDSQPGSSASSLIVTRHGLRVEISLLKGPHIAFSHSAQVAGEGEQADNQAIIAAVARSLMGLSGPVQSRDINRAYLLGSNEEFEVLAPALEKRLSPDVEILDPFAVAGVIVKTTLPENRSSYAALVGSLLAQSGAQAATINFLAPRKPPVKPDHTRSRALMAGAAAAILAVSFGGYLYFKTSALDKEIARLKDLESQIAGQVEANESILKSVELIGEWADVREEWLDELVVFSRQMPPPDRAFLTQWKLDLGTADAGAKLSLDGYSRERKDVIEFSDRLLKDSRYQLEVHDSTPDKNDPFHPWKLDVEVRIEPDAPPVELTAITPKKDESPKKPEQEKPSGQQKNKTQASPTSEEKAVKSQTAKPVVEKQEGGRS